MRDNRLRLHASMMAVEFQWNAAGSYARAVSWRQRYAKEDASPDMRDYYLREVLFHTGQHAYYSKLARFYLFALLED